MGQVDEESGSQADELDSGTATKKVPDAPGDQLAVGSALATPVPAVGGAEEPAVGGAEKPADGHAELDVDTEHENTSYIQVVHNWLEELATQAKAKGRTLCDELSSLYPTPAETKASILKIIPWKPQVGYVNFLRQPTTNMSGALHVAVLRFDPGGYPGKGVYMEDAMVLLSTTAVGVLFSRKVQVRPSSASCDLSCFGWEADGALVNGTFCFVFSALALYSVLHPSVPVPTTISEMLAAIGATYTRHDTAEQRLVNRMIASQASSIVNRPVDPLWLSRELSRNCFSSEKVRVIMKLYKQRALVNKALALPSHVEECTIRLMDSAKAASACPLWLLSTRPHVFLCRTACFQQHEEAYMGREGGEGPGSFSENLAPICARWARRANRYLLKWCRCTGGRAAPSQKACCWSHRLPLAAL